jgi:mono/diheme cytochrome c family protein
MKLRSFFSLAILTFLLTACNFTLAADVTPPPNYVPPTPLPTMGPLYPAQKMDIYNGVSIYMEKCVDCHGADGLGDGEQGKQLPVTVAAIGLPDIAMKAQPAAWYTQVTQGNLERFMPPFASLTDKERWDVVGYALFMHMDPQQLDQGQELFEANCPNCEKYFTDLKVMSTLSENDLIAIVKNGKGEIPAFGKNLSDAELATVAVYLRSLTFTLPAGHGASAAATASPEPSAPAAETTDGTQVAPAEATAAPSQKAAGIGNVSGTVENKTGASLPSNIKVTLRGYEHGSDPNAGPTEVFTLEGVVNADGKYLFENMDFPENRIYLAEITLNDQVYSSEFAVVSPDMTEAVLSPIVIYATTEDYSILKMPSLQLYFDFATEGDIQVFAVYSIVNDSDKTLLVTMGADQAVPFIAFPAGSKQLGLEAAQDSAPFMPTKDGFGMSPSETPYGLIAFGSLPRAKEIAFSQTALVPVNDVSLFLPEGVSAEGKNLTDEGMQAMQGMNFHVYRLGSVAKDGSIEFTLTGAPQTTAVNPDVTQNKNLLIGVGAFGVVLILAGVWLYIRDRKKEKEDEGEDEEDEEEDDDSDPEEIMDAIIALDDLHRAGKLSDEAYQQRRAELKSKLKK